MVLTATLVEHRVVSFDSLKSTWTTQPADVIMVDDTAFVRVAGYAPMPVLTEQLDVKVRYLSPEKSKGLSELLKLREEAEERTATEEDSACTLFEPAKKKSKLSKDTVSEMRQNPKTIEIEIEVGDEKNPNQCYKACASQRQFVCCLRCHSAFCYHTVHQGPWIPRCAYS